MSEPGLWMTRRGSTSLRLQRRACRSSSTTPRVSSSCAKRLSPSSTARASQRSAGTRLLEHWARRSARSVGCCPSTPSWRSWQRTRWHGVAGTAATAGSAMGNRWRRRCTSCVRCYPTTSIVLPRSWCGCGSSWPVPEHPLTPGTPRVWSRLPCGERWQIAERGWADPESTAGPGASTSGSEAGDTGDPLAEHAQWREEEVDHRIAAALELLAVPPSAREVEAELLRAVTHGLTWGVCRGRLTPAEAVTRLEHHLAVLSQRPARPPRRRIPS